MYGKDLLSDLKSELHGDFEDLVLALMERPPVYDAIQLRKAMEVRALSLSLSRVIIFQLGEGKTIDY